ncbi:hypothetical protein J6590_088610 [Homalodisca vitripennis]|nr:hypothetical protein J6590_088610 [Homalodisca vitripennis]
MKRKKPNRLFYNDSDIEDELGDSDELSSLYSSNGESKCVPADSSNDGEPSDEDETRPITEPENVSFSVGLDGNDPIFHDPNIEFVLENVDNNMNDDMTNDPNVHFVVDRDHMGYDERQLCWTDKNNIPPIHNFIGQEKINTDSTNPVEIFSKLFDDALLNNIVTWINNRALLIRGMPSPKHSHKLVEAYHY